MLTLTGRILDVSELPGREDFPPTFLVKLLDGHEPLNLVASKEVYEQLAPLGEGHEVSVRLSWRLLKLRELGGSGNAYRLRIVGVVE